MIRVLVITVKTMRNLLLACYLMSQLSGCQSQTPDAQVTQVLAKVNGDEITSHQVNGELQRLQMPVANTQLTTQILNSLIDRQLLVQEAVKLNIDRTPEVMQLVEMAKAQIYAQAYLARKISTQSQAKNEEINEFMAKHPEIFSHRKIFTTRSYIFPHQALKPGDAQLQSSVKNADELTAWLDSHAVKFEVLEETIPTEVLPKEVLSIADQIKVGDLLFMRDGTNIMVRSVTSIIDQPMPAVHAKAMASKVVSDHKRQQRILDEIKRLKKLAKIEVLDASLKADMATISDHHESSLQDGLKGL